MLPMTGVVKNLLVINALFFLATIIFGENQMLDLMALHYPTSSEFLPLQLATHFFMHGGVVHLFFNMFALVMFGAVLEKMWGAQRFLFYYFVCAFGAAALHMGFTWWEISQIETLTTSFSAAPSAEIYHEFMSFTGLDSRDFAADINYEVNKGLTPALINDVSGLMNDFMGVKEDIPIVGASGAIYGLLLAFGMLFPNAELMLIFLPIPIKAKYFIPILMLLEVYLGFNQFSWDNIAHFAHLGGAVTGFLLILYWRKFGSRWDNAN